MGRRGRRKGHRRSKPTREQQGHSASALPANFERGLVRFASIVSGLDPDADLGAEVDRQAAALDELLAPLDAVRVLGQIVLREVPLDAETYRESEHDGAAHIVETIAGALVSREARAPGSATEPFMDASVLDPIRDRAQDVALLEGLRRMGRPEPGAKPPDALLALRQRAALQDVVLRAPGWPWQEYTILRGLFGPSHVADRLVDALGFDAADAITCSEALPTLLNSRYRVGMTSSQDPEKVRAWADKTIPDRGDPVHEDFEARALEALWRLQHVGDALLIEAPDLASEAGIVESRAAAFLSALSTSFGESGRLFERAGRVRERPFIDLADGRWFCTVPSNVVFALRGLFESALAGDQRYLEHRGSWLEAAAATMLADALHPDELHTSVDIFPEGGGSKLGEIDVLLRFGDTAIAVEAKSFTLNRGARRGGEALVQQLKKNLTKAADQGSLACDALLPGAAVQLRTRDGAALALGESIREVQPIVVTLDDLSAVAPIMWEIGGTKLLPEDTTIPWVVTLHELDLVCRTVAWPMQLVHFLRRRARMNQLRGRIASEELDWWMLYLENSLYFEHEDRADDQHIRYLSQTDPLDAWALHEQGLRQTPAPKPRQQLDPASEKVLNRLTAERPDGWIAAGCLLLDASDAGRMALHADVREALTRAANGKVQRRASGARDAATAFLFCVVVVPDEGAAQLQTELVSYVDERLSEYGMQRVLGLGLTRSSRREYDALIVVEHGRWRLPEIE